MELSRPEYCSGYPFPSPGNLPNPGIEPRSPALQADSLTAEPPGKPVPGLDALFSVTLAYCPFRLTLVHSPASPRGLLGS